MTILNPFKCRDLLRDGGTLLWIGDRTLPEFRDAYEIGENLASQVAFRPDLISSLDRPASNVGLIIHASNSRAELDIGLWKQIEAQYGEASRMRFCGPLCEGIRSSAELNFDAGTYDWRKATYALSSCFDTEKPSQDQGPPVVAVIAARYSIAEPLLDLAASCGAVSVWRRESGLADMRGVNVVWWDDSFAGPTDKLGWRERIASMGGSATRHAWLTHRPHWLQMDQAMQAGVEVVLGKPYSVEPLTEMLGSHVAEGSSRQSSARASAQSSSRAA